MVRCSNIYPRRGTVLLGARRCPQESKCWGLSAQAPSAVGVSTTFFKLRLRRLVLRPILSMHCMHLCREICRVKSDLWSDPLLTVPKEMTKEMFSLGNVPTLMLFYNCNRRGVEAG